METCKWIYAPGTNNSHFAFTECHNWEYIYLSKLNKSEPYIGVADYYNGRICPRCRKKIEIDYKRIETCLGIKNKKG